MRNRLKIAVLTSGKTNEFDWTGAEYDNLEINLAELNNQYDHVYTKAMMPYPRRKPIGILCGEAKTKMQNTRHWRVLENSTTFRFVHCYNIEMIAFRFT
jgi:hypothetical protein